MKIKTSELSGVALDWAVAKAEWLVHEGDMRGVYIADYSIDWNHAGPIIEREMRLGMNLYGDGGTFGASYYNIDAEDTEASLFGDTPLIAAMRCYVASKLGGTVEVPDELV